MKQFALVVAAAALMGGAPALAVDVVPPHEVFASVRSMGFDPLTRPALRGEVYVLRAANRYGEAVRVVVEARGGEVISVGPGARSRHYFYEPTLRPPAAIPGPRHWPQRSAPRIAPADVLEDEDVGFLPRNPHRVTGAARGSETPARLSASTVALPAKPPLPRPRPAATLAASSEPADTVTGSIGQASAKAPMPLEARPDPAMPPMQGFD